MEKRSTAAYVWIGTAVRYLQDSREHARIFGRARLEGNIDDLLVSLERAEFFVSLRLAAPLAEMVEGWRAEFEEHDGDEEWAESRRLTTDEATRLLRTAGTLRDAVVAEAAGQVAYVASDGRYLVAKLLEDIGALMGQGVYEKLPDLAKFDFEEAGKAIAFDLPTAAAFHLLRGTEAVLRDFYMKVVKRDRIPEPRMWAAIVADLRKRRSAPPAMLLNNLDSLRAHYRNPTQHPEKTYDLDEAQDLLALAFDAVGRMVRHIESK
jgi:hypothetical protein